MSLVYTDFLIIGSGISGLFSALKLQKLGKVTVITKKEKYEANTSYAQGGIASVFSIQDNLEDHYNDTLKAGAGLCNPESVKIVVSEGPNLVQELFELGVPFSLDKDGNFSLSREGGHSRNRIVHVADQTGREIQNILLQKIKEKNIKILEHYSLIDLITPHHLNKSYKNKVCYGAYILNNKSNKTLTFIAKKTILATGGAGQVYLHTTNPKIATGDGIACAYRAGAYIKNMEFYQFHPTFFHNETGVSFLISEVVRGEGATLETKEGFRFMQNYHEMMELAPRDIVARAIDAEMKKQGKNFVYLNLTHLPKERINLKFPFIKKQCEKIGINIFTNRIPIVPAAHYMCGGVNCNLYGETNIENLFAVGEVSHTGIHGANRLASNSLLECIVFSNRIYQLLKNKNLEYPKEIKNIPEWKKENRTFNKEIGLISNHIKEIQTIMSHYVGIVRSNFRLERAEKRINLIFKEVLDFYNKTIMTSELLELRNLIYTSSLMIRSAKQRKESRGLHYNKDYKESKTESRQDTTLQSSEYI